MLMALRMGAAARTTAKYDWMAYAPWVDRRPQRGGGFSPGRASEQHPLQPGSPPAPSHRQ